MKIFWSNIPGNFVDSATGIPANKQSKNKPFAPIFGGSEDEWRNTITESIARLREKSGRRLECGTYAFGVLEKVKLPEGVTIRCDTSLPERVIRVDGNELEIISSI
jgi:hypothetical protein